MRQPQTLAEQMRLCAEQTRLFAADARWAIPLTAYRLSRGRIGDSLQLYRAGVLSQRVRGRRLPGMTSATERAYFKWHAQDRFQGRGTIVDLGSWFGSTTATLAMGLVRNRRPAAAREVIHAFDRFTWEWWMAPYASAAKLGTYVEGESFLREFERVVSPWRRRIEVHPGDLREETWTGQPIEVLLVDAMKSWELTHHILAKFYGDLVVGDGYVIHQDFSNCFTPWIHLTCYRLRDHLVPVVDIPRSEDVVFRVVCSFEDPALLSAARESFDEAEIEKAFAYSRSITRADKHSGINASRAMLLVYDGDLAQARAYIQRAETAGTLNSFHVGAVRRAMESSEALA